jgi:L-arabinose isomerase
MSIGKGLHFKIVNREEFAEDLFAGVCVAFGCSPPMNRAVANAVATGGEHKTTVTQSINISHLRGACSMIGIMVMEISPRRTWCVS